jgi:hypothetical protein
LRYLSEKYEVPVEAVRDLAQEMEKTGGTSVRFDIEALGGKGLWNMNRHASVGNGFNEQLNELVAALCNDLSQSIRAEVPEDEPTLVNRQPRSKLDDTVALMPVSIKPTIWWPEHYGESADAIGNAGAVRYAYFEGCNRLVVRQNLRNRIFDTNGYEVYNVSAGKQPGFFNLIVNTSNGSLPITKLKEVVQ